MEAGRGGSAAEGEGAAAAGTADGAAGRMTAESVGEDEIRRVAALMRIDIGAAGGEEAREHIDKVRAMIGYFDVLDGAGVGAAGDGASVGAAGGAAVRLDDLRDDEPEEGGAAGAGTYARVQQEGGTYVRAPAMSP